MDGIHKVAMVEGFEEVGETKNFKMCHGIQEHPQKFSDTFSKYTVNSGSGGNSRRQSIC